MSSPKIIKHQTLGPKSVMLIKKMSVQCLSHCLVTVLNPNVGVFLFMLSLVFSFANKGSRVRTSLSDWLLASTGLYNEVRFLCVKLCSVLVQ